MRRAVPLCRGVLPGAFLFARFSATNCRTGGVKIGSDFRAKTAQGLLLLLFATFNRDRSRFRFVTPAMYRYI